MKIILELDRNKKISNPTQSDFKYPSDFGFLEKCRIPWRTCNKCSLHWEWRGSWRRCREEGEPCQRSQASNTQTQIHSH